MGSKEIFIYSLDFYGNNLLRVGLDSVWFHVNVYSFGLSDV